MKFTLRHDNPANRSMVHGRIHAALQCLDTAKSWDVFIKEHKTNRSIKQNAYLWQLLTIIADETGHTKDELYEYYIDQYAPVEVREVFGSAKRIRTTSSRMNVGQMADFITRIEAHAADLGIRLAARVV